jgi:cytochrome P450
MGHVASNDPEAYREPRRLDITRPDAASHMVFGHGPHHCPGAALARMKLQRRLSDLSVSFRARRVVCRQEGQASIRLSDTLIG